MGFLCFLEWASTRTHAIAFCDQWKFPNVVLQGQPHRKCIALYLIELWLQDVLHRWNLPSSERDTVNTLAGVLCRYSGPQPLPDPPKVWLDPGAPPNCKSDLSEGVLPHAEQAVLPGQCGFSYWAVNRLSYRKLPLLTASPSLSPDTAISRMLWNRKAELGIIIILDSSDLWTMQESPTDA